MSLTVHYYSDLRVLDISSAGLTDFVDQISNSLISTQSASLVTIQSYNSSSIYVAATTSLENTTTLESSSPVGPNERIASATSPSASTTVTTSVADGSFDSYTTSLKSKSGAAHISCPDLKRKVFLMLTIPAFAALITI